MSSIRWKKFFVEAGLPADPCENYAVIFSENRIRFDMLDELNKDILHDMGIRKMGDVISILRHAKSVHSSSYRERMLANRDDDEGGNVTEKATNESSKSSNKPDSTIQVDKPKISLQAGVITERRVILPKKEVVNTGQQQQVKSPTVRRVAPAREPVIIRNVTGLSDNTSSSERVQQVTVSRKRIFAPADEEDPDDDQEPLMMQPVTKLSKPDLIITDPQVRNRIDAQSRLSNFSSVIQKALTANKSQQPLLSASEAVPLTRDLKSRLTLNKADSTTITVNRTPTAPSAAKSNQSVRSNLQSVRNNLQPARSTLQQLPRLKKLDVKSRLGRVSSGDVNSSSGVKERLGRKSVFDRFDNKHTQSTNRSVFNRLGAKQL